MGKVGSRVVDDRVVTTAALQYHAPEWCMFCTSRGISRALAPYAASSVSAEPAPQSTGEDWWWRGARGFAAGSDAHGLAMRHGWMEKGNATHLATSTTRIGDYDNYSPIHP